MSLIKERANSTKFHNKAKELEVRSTKLPSLQTKEEQINIINLQKENKTLKDQLNKQTVKLEQERSNCHNLKNEKNSLIKLVQQEVGISFEEIQKMIQDGVETLGWKSRSQQITTLKDKVKSLTQKLRMSSTASVSSFDDYFQDETGSIRFNEQHKSALQKYQNERRSTMEKAIGELELNKNELNSLKTKNEGLIARNKALEKDSKAHKLKINALITKSDSDDKLVDLLKSTLNQMKEQVSETKRKISITKKITNSEYINKGIQVSTLFETSIIKSKDTKSADELVQIFEYENRKLHMIKNDLSSRLRNTEMRIYEMEKALNDIKKDKEIDSNSSRKSNTNEMHQHICTESQRLKRKLEISKDFSLFDKIIR
jgi:myosin heavy subunit